MSFLTKIKAMQFDPPQGQNYRERAEKMATGAGDWPQFKPISSQYIKQILDSARTAKKKGKALNEDDVKLLLEPDNFTIHDLLWNCMKMLSEKKLRWNDIAIMQDRWEPKGFPIFPADALGRIITKRDLDGPAPLVKN